MLDYREIEHKTARQVTILTGDDVVLVKDGKKTRGFKNVPLGSSSGGSWLRIKVEENKAGGSARILVEDDLTEHLKHADPMRLHHFERGSKYYWGRRDQKPAIKAE